MASSNEKRKQRAPVFNDPLMIEKQIERRRKMLKLRRSVGRPASAEAKKTNNLENYLK